MQTVLYNALYTNELAANDDASWSAPILKMKTVIEGSLQFKYQIIFIIDMYIVKLCKWYKNISIWICLGVAKSLMF